MTRPKHVDVDKPQGYLKRKVRRWVRVQLMRDTAQQIEEYYHGND